ncbi:TPA: hypothetical protein QHS71_002212 [Escherichia coli]|nr:hypothetical protein [Escherichia coli]
MKIDFFVCDYFHKLHFFRNELNTMKKYNSHSEIYWQSVSEDVNNSMLCELNDAETEEHENIVDAYVEELIVAQSTAPRFHREALLVSIYCQTEYTLLDFCSCFNQEVMNRKSNFDSLSKHSVLNNIQDYLQKVMGFDLSEFNYEWGYLKNIKLIRNRLVHSNGKVVMNIDEINSFCEKNKNFIIKNEFILMRKDAIEDFIKTLFHLLDILEGENQKLITRHQEKHGVYNHLPICNI